MAARKFEQWPDEAIGLLGAVLDCLPQSIAVLDQSGRIVTVNQAWIDSACSNGAPPDAEWIGVDYLAACRSVERNAQKGASSSCDAIRDVLAESEKRFRATFEQAAVGIAHVASDGRFLRINRKFCDIVGYSPKEMQERTFRDITHPDDLDAELEQLGRLLEGQESACALEQRYLGKGGSIVWINLTVSLVRNEAGNPDYLVAVVEDITERKTAEMRLRETQERLRALAFELTHAEERERQSLAAELHDRVARSLTFMGMQLTAARKQSAGRKVVATLDKVSESLHQVIQDTRNIMWDLSAPGRNEQGLPAVMAERLTGKISERYGLETELIDDGEAKPLGAETTAVLFRSVRELLLNVVKHAHATRVTVSLQRKEGVVEIVVPDNGKGLSDGSIPAQESCSCGFGLRSIQERMRHLGGSLTIESRPGQGVKACLTVPLEVG
ncbi:MAG: PAS domain S-box protein [Gammaproteobacteria bacterium]|jgi:two-component system sensor histidine kinase UhpB